MDDSFRIHKGDPRVSELDSFVVSPARSPNEIAGTAMRSRFDPSQLEPKAALEFLYEGNRRFAFGKRFEPHRNESRLQETVHRQTPFAAFIGCADLRVPIEIIFDQGFGDLLITLICGNVATSENIGSLEIGIEVFGVKVLFVLGHTNCGAVATMKRDRVPGQIGSLFRNIRPAVGSAAKDLDQAVSDNVRLQVRKLAEASPVIAQRIRDGKLIVVGGVYDLSTGLVRPVSGSSHLGRSDSADPGPRRSAE
jgi:carbonic anhydrase